ncbi:MAG: histidine phosphatase family protein [Clostridiales bacterium]|jgi:probable phosphoglycerate mutase|nr:histidine phosphatase family protein [Clostridiales bacterium]
MKKFISVLLTIALTTAIPFAASGAEITKKLEYNNYSVTINGQEIQMIDAKGAVIEPFAIEGNVYMPLRGLSKALGLSVGYDEKTNKITLSEAPLLEKSSELTIYLVRHGKTFFNTTDQVQGFIDSPLTEVGISQAQAVGRSMADIQFTTAFTGRLGRHIDTAQTILDNNKNWTPDIIQNVGWNEWNYGGYEGKTNSEMWSPIFEANGLTFDSDWTYYNDLVAKLGDRGVADAIAANDPLKAAESYDEIVARAKSAMDELIKVSLDAGGGNVLVVSSGGMIPTMLEIFFPGHEATNIDNCSVSVLKYADGKLSIDHLNDLSYRNETRDKN